MSDILTQTSLKIDVPMDLYYALKTVELHDLCIILNEKSEKKCKKSIDGGIPPIYITDMAPSKHRADKRQLAVWLPLPLLKRFQKRAAALGMTMTELIIAFVVQQTQNIELTQEDYEEIARIIREKTNF